MVMGNLNKMTIRPEILTCLILHEEVRKELSQELTLPLKRKFQGELRGDGEKVEDKKVVGV